MDLEENPELADLEKAGLTYEKMGHLKQICIGKALANYLNRNIQKIKEICETYHTNRVKAAEIFLTQKTPEKTQVDISLENQLQSEIVKKKSTNPDGSIDLSKVLIMADNVSSYFRPRFINIMRYILHQQKDTYERIIEIFEKNQPKIGYKHP